MSARSIILILFRSYRPAAVNRLKIQHQEDPNSTTLAANKSVLLRSLFTVGTLARHFDFDLEEFKGTSKVGLLSTILILKSCGSYCVATLHVTFEVYLFEINQYMLPVKRLGTPHATYFTADRY